MTCFERFSNKFLISILLLVLFLKVIFYYAISFDFFSINVGGGSDAEYYHRYALGLTDVATSLWPIILRYLNDLGLYSRDLISFLLLWFNLVLIPFLTCKISNLNFKNNQKIFIYLFLLMTIYPTLYFYTFDIVRDVFMVFCFLIGCLCVKKALNSGRVLYFIFYLLAILIGFLLLNLRPYLGYAFLLALFLWKIKITKKILLFLGIIYIWFLFILNYIGLLDQLTEYRAGFEEVDGGSTLGLDFSNPVMFIPNFILSTLGQLFGLYITNSLAILLLLLETLPLFFMLIYVIKNMRFADKFIYFLIIFFVLYASVWLIGNDNLGTAVRLRIFNYLAIYICFFYILSIKAKLKQSIKV